MSSILSPKQRGTGNNEWYTPPRFIEAARRVMGCIDLDPASSDAANTIVDAERHYTKEEDGLTKKWYGRVWLNPPYARGLCASFIDKLESEWHRGDVVEAITLTHASTDTAWCQKLMHLARAICLIKGRICFIDPATMEVKEGSPLQGTLIAYLGDHPSWFRAVFKEYGITWVAR